MTTLVRRTFASTPARDAHATWLAISDLLTRGQSGEKRDELLSVAGIAASIISDHAAEEAPIVVSCDGPRTRIYCIHDDDALDASEADENELGFDPLAGDWAVSLPCLAEDLDWVKAALKKRSSRITARDAATGFAVEQAESKAGAGLVLDTEGFLGS